MKQTAAEAAPAQQQKAPETQPTNSEAKESKVYQEAMERIADVEEDMGTLEFDRIPEEKDLQPTDDGAGTTYAGQKNAKGEKEGFGIKNYPKGALYFGLWKAGKASG